MCLLNRLSRLIVFVVIFFNALFLLGQSKQVSLVIPTAEDEANYIWKNIKDIGFFDKNGYSVNFPRWTFVDSLLNSSRKNELNQSNYKELIKFIVDSVYNINDYSKGSDKITNGISTIVCYYPIIKTELELGFFDLSVL